MDIKLIADLQRLDEHYRVVALEVIQMLLRIGQQR